MSIPYQCEQGAFSIAVVEVVDLADDQAVNLIR